MPYTHTHTSGEFMKQIAGFTAITEWTIFKEVSK